MAPKERLVILVVLAVSARVTSIVAQGQAHTSQPPLYLDQRGKQTEPCSLTHCHGREPSEGKALETAVKRQAREKLWTCGDYFVKWLDRRQPSGTSDTHQNCSLGLSGPLSVSPCSLCRSLGLFKT